MQGPEGSLCRAGFGLGPKGPNPCRVAKSGPVGFGPKRPILGKKGAILGKKKVRFWAKKVQNWARPIMAI